MRTAGRAPSSGAGTGDSGVASDAASERGARGDGDGKDGKSDPPGDGGARSRTGGGARGLGGGRDSTGDSGDARAVGMGTGVKPSDGGIGTSDGERGRTMGERARAEEGSGMSSGGREE